MVLVWCPVHCVYLHGRKAKLRHAYSKSVNCDWMKKYIKRHKEMEDKL